jgi:methionine--tRNA ligase beta chain
MAEPPAVVQFDDFLKLNLRVGTITQAELHPQADKLIVLQVDLGSEQRQLVAGIRGHYDPPALVGKQIIVVANLAPRVMRGVESQGMLLAATSPDQSQVILLTTERPIAPGSRVS